MKPAMNQPTKPSEVPFVPRRIRLPNGIAIQPRLNPDGTMSEASAALIRSALKVPTATVDSFRTAKPLPPT